MLSTESIVAICGVALGALQTVNMIISARNGRKADVAIQKAEANAAKQDVIVEKVDGVHSLADGHLTKVSNDLALANEKIEGLRTVIAVQGAVMPQAPVVVQNGNAK